MAEMLATITRMQTLTLYVDAVDEKEAEEKVLNLLEKTLDLQYLPTDFGLEEERFDDWELEEVCEA